MKKQIYSVALALVSCLFSSEWAYSQNAPCQAEWDRYKQAHLQYCPFASNRGCANELEGYSGAKAWSDTCRNLSSSLENDGQWSLKAQIQIYERSIAHNKTRTDLREPSSQAYVNRSIAGDEHSLCVLKNFSLCGKGGATNTPSKDKSDTTPTDQSRSKMDSPTTSNSPDDRRQRDERLAQSEGRYREQRAAYDKAYQNKPKKHKQDMEASECLVKSPIGRRSVYNKCSFDVEVSFCMEKPDQKAFETNFFEDGWARDCDQGKGGMWVVSAGKHLSGNYTGGKFHWFACKKPAIPHAKWNPTARELQGYCD